jgi:enoyl-CoA hydratase/carnithine racemase
MCDRYMNTLENRMNPEFINRIHDALDEVEKFDGPTALITVSLSKKNIYSNGLDLDWWGKNPDKGWGLVSDYIRLLGRFLIFPCPTIAVSSYIISSASKVMLLPVDECLQWPTTTE